MGRDTAALIVAAGSGRRLGADRPKALVELAGKQLFRWSLEACFAAGSVGPVLIAAPAGYSDDFEVEGVEVVTGGKTRSESVARGLERVESELVMVHDAARPLVSPGLIDGTIARLAQSPHLDAVIAATPATDTVKRMGEDGLVETTVDRSALRLAQTPQAFRTAALRRAMAAGDPASATDDASLIEAAGGSVGVIDAPSGNIKVTIPEDLAIAALLLARAGRREGVRPGSETPPSGTGTPGTRLEPE